MKLNSKHDNIVAIAQFTQILKENPNSAYDFICNNAHRMSKYDLKNIIRELLYGLHHHLNNRLYEDLYCDILSDVQIELDKLYEDVH